MCQGMSLVIVAFMQEQIRNLRRFCAMDTTQALMTAVGVNRTFNFGLCFVTVTIYRNMSVLCKTTQDNPIFLGPVMFHYDGRCDTYKMFSTVSVMLCVQMWQWLSLQVTWIWCLVRMKRRLWGSTVSSIPYNSIHLLRTTHRERASVHDRCCPAFSKGAGEGDFRDRLGS